MAYYPITPVQVGRNAMLDFSPVTNALDDYQAQRARNRQFGMQEQQLGMDRERLQLAKNADARAGEDQAWQKEQRLVQKFGALAQVIRDDPNPATAMANWQKLTQRVPQLAQKLRGYGIDPSDYKASAAFLMAEAGKYKTPQQMEMERLKLAQARQGVTAGDLDIQAKRRQLSAPPPDGSKVMEVNGNIVRVPRSGPGQVVYQGSPKMDATTRKEISEADDFVAQTNTAIGALTEALRLNNIAYDGKGASTRADVMNNIPFVGGTENSLATTDLENVVTNQALQSLRATFGGNPTEGERRILMEVAGSVSLPAKVREGIYRRALTMAQQRLRINQEKARALRSGTYYQQDGQPTSVNDPVNLSPRGGQQDNPYAGMSDAQLMEMLK